LRRGKMTDWVPTPDDVTWMQGVLQMLKEGGTWGIPESESCFTFYHSRKKYDFKGDQKHETNQRSFKLLKLLGWEQEIWN
jgi:hypothetical protein